MIMAVTLAGSPVLASEGEPGEAHGVPTKAVLFAALNFILLILILAYFLRKPVKEFFASRAAIIKADINDSEALKNQAEEKFHEYERRLKGIEAEMNHLVEELKKDGELEKAKLVQAAKEQAASLQETSERVMSTELKRAKEELKREAVSLAAELAEELIRKNITAEDQKRLVQTYIDKMEHLS